MRNTDTFRQYIWLINTVQNAKRITFEQIQQRWINDDLNEGNPLSRSTFHRLKVAIEDMFGIIISCEATEGYTYYISNPEVLRDNSTQRWMLKTLTVSNMLNDGLAIKERLVLEDIPAGLEYLQTIINAMKHNHLLMMGYHKFDDPEGYTSPIEPYCLKMFKQRWYLLGRNTDKGDNLHIYALDRITSIEETDQIFELKPDFNADTFFDNYFGVFIGGDQTAERVVLRARGKMINLMRTLPKHHSQKEIKTTKNYADFELFLVPTFDFRQEILKEGPDLEVLEPETLKNEIKSALEKSLNQYK